MKKSSNGGLIIAFILVCLVAVLGIIGTIYFYNKNLDDNVEDKPGVEDNNNNDNNNDNNNNDDNNAISESLKFTSLEEYELSSNDEKEVTINNKTLKFKTINDQLYFNDKKIEASYTKIYVTNLVVLFIKNYGQWGAVYSVYDLDGNDVTYSIDNSYQFVGLRIEDDKLRADVYNEKVIWMEGYRIGNLITGSEPWVDCTKRLKDYPDVVEEHKDDILEADYYFEYSNHELSLKVLKVKLTVGDLELDTCVSEN